MIGVAEFDRSFEAQQIMRAPKRDTTTITDVLRRWAAGHDTALIAASTGVPQPDVCRIIAADQDCRHAERAARAEAVIAETVQARSGRLHRV